MDYNYNYVIFNGSDGNYGPYNEEGYFSICLRDLWPLENVVINSAPLDYTNKFLRFLNRIHCSPHFNLPFQNIWSPYFFKNTLKDDKPICFLLMTNLSSVYLKWLKSHYPTAVFIRFYRDLVETQQEHYDRLLATGIIDYWMSFDELQAEKYGMYYYHEIESKIELPSDNKINYDVFFSARAKNRLKKIIAAYDRLTEKGYKCYFYITGASKDEIEYRDGIVYSNKLMSYRKMLQYSIQSKCLLDINQQNGVGYTSRLIEAIMYNKCLITDNKSIKNTSFYNPKFVEYFKDVATINANVINNYAEVDYLYNNEFSPIGLLDYIDSMISK